MVSLQIDEDLVVLNCKAGSREQVLKILCDQVYAKGYTTDKFYEKLIEREAEFPTGLEMAIPIAIPHVGGQCHESFLALAVLEKPINFYAMDGTGKELPINLVFMFGITDPADQVEVLKSFIFAFQVEENIRKFLAVQSKEETIMLLKELLGDGLKVNKLVKEEAV